MTKHTTNDDMKKHVGRTYMTREITDDLVDEARRQLVAARMRLLFRHPFFGQIALRLVLEPADRKWCPTAATDGRKFYYNPAFIAELDEKEHVFLVAHELGHCIYEHFLRRQGREPKLWNIANDYVINNMLEIELVKKAEKGEYARVITYVKPFLNHDYDGWASEEVYDDLQQKQQNGADPEKDGDLIDVHISLDGSGDGGDEEGVEVPGISSDGLAERPGPLSDDEQKQLSNEMKDAMISAAQSVGADKLPGDVKRMITDLLEPQMDWREIIRAQIESSLKANFTWMRPNRKGWHIPAILPGMERDFMIDVALAIDTSGSISQAMLTEFVSEIAGIMEQYEHYRIQIWQFDTKVYGYDKFTSDDARDIREYEFKGGGGTDFMANWKFMKKNEITPDQFIMFTDGQPYDSWGDPDYCDTVFLINTTYGKPEAPFGQSVYYKQQQQTQ